MQKHEIKKLSQINEAQAAQAFEVYTESFYDMMSKTITKDKAKLRAIYEACFDRELVYVYLLEGRVVGFLGYATQGNHSIKPQRNVMAKHLGLWGHGVHWGLNYYQPKAESANHAIIEYCAVCPSARGQGVGARLIEHLCDVLPHTEFTLETTEENSSAVRLYSKLGFVKLPKKLSVLVRGFAKVFKLGTPIYMKLQVASSMKNVQ